MAFVAQGTVFSIGETALDLTPVAELTKINGPQHKREDVDVTSHDSQYRKEFLPGLIEAGEIDCEGNYVPSDAGMKLVISAVSTNADLIYWEIMFPNGYGFSGLGLVTVFKPSGPFDDKAEVSFTVKVSGEVTFIEPVS